MPVAQFMVSVEVDALEEDGMTRERVLEYIRVGIQNALLRESRCIGLLPPRVTSQREEIRTALIGVREPA
jgi:hypothetical protein